MRILVLGSSGMLGHKMLERLRLHFEHVDGASRQDGFYATVPDSVRQTLQRFKPSVVVNCAGTVKQRQTFQEEFIAMNALLPHMLARLCLVGGARLIHFSSDCVFSGKRGLYTESDRPDPEDVYGQTKLLGEVCGDHALTLRTSIVGRERRNYHGLLEWFLRQRGGNVQGYRGAIFAGVTTNWLSDVVAHLIDRDILRGGLYQVAAVPVTKNHLLNMFKIVYNRHDINITPVAGQHCDRSLCGDRFTTATGIESPYLESLLVTQREQDRGSGYAI